MSWLAGAGPPATAQLDVAEHVKPGTSSVVAGYADLAGLVATLDAAFPEAKEEGGGGGRGAPPPPRDGGGGVPAPAEGGSRGWGQPSPGARGVGGGWERGWVCRQGKVPRGHPPARIRLACLDKPPSQPPAPSPPAPHTGADDLYPPGLGPGLPGLVGPGLPPEFGAPSVRGYHPGGPGGGMVVGPDDPLFGGHPGLRPPGAGPGGLPPPGLPPGARWDPVRPPGLPGFAPEDFRRGPGGPPGPHPDIMPPGPGGPGFGGGGAGMFG